MGRLEDVLGGLVGREAESALAAAAVRQLSKGWASALAIEGEAGIGKARLTQSIVDDARSRDVVWVTRWVCIGWVSPVMLMNSQSSTVPAFGLSVGLAFSKSKPLRFNAQPGGAGRHSGAGQPGAARPADPAPGRVTVVADGAAGAGTADAAEDPGGTTRPCPPPASWSRKTPTTVLGQPSRRRPRTGLLPAGRDRASDGWRGPARSAA